MMKGEMMHIELTFTAPRYSHFPTELSLIDFALFQIAKLRKRFWTPQKTNRVIMLFCSRNKQWVSLNMSNLQGWAGDPGLLEHRKLSVACYHQLQRYCSLIFRANLNRNAVLYTVSHLDEACSDQPIIRLYVIHSRSKLFWWILWAWCRLRPK